MVCRNCGVLPSSSFFVRKSGYVSPICCECERKESRERRRNSYKINSDKIKSQNSSWYSKHKGGSKQESDSWTEVRKLVSESEWTQIKPAFGSHDLSGYINSIRNGGYLPNNELVNNIYKRLSLVELSSPLSQLYNGLNYLDNNFSHRYEASTSGRLSFHSSFYDDNEFIKVIKYIVKTKRQPTKGLIIQNMKFSVSLPSHFFASSAAAVASVFKDKDVFDPFLGWGGRTLGSVCVGVKSITGTDLQQKSVDGCYKIMNDFSGLSNTVGEFHKCNFSEYMETCGRKFDLIFTSPPFVDLENYGSDSMSTSLEQWIKSVVVPLVSLSKRVLNERGQIAVHVQDKPRVPVLSSVLSCFLGAGYQISSEYKYGKRGGQKVIMFK
jgi:16S rRNA G966 N2-methylase RsmD